MTQETSLAPLFKYRSRPFASNSSRYVTPLIPRLNPNNLPLYVLILVVVVISIIGGSLIMGLWGMVFAVPAVVVVKTATETIFKELKDYRII